MLSRITFILITLLWVTMNILLWRAEYGARADTGSLVPVKTVWQKILNAPDDSPLNILSRGRRVGNCRVQTGVAEELSKLDEAPKGGMSVKSRIQCDGSLRFEEGAFRRLRFQCDLSLSASQEWEQFNLRLMHRPIAFEAHSVAAEQTVHMKVTDGEADFERTFKLSEFQNPMALLGSITESLLGAPFSELEFPIVAGQPAPQLPAVKWEASNDMLTIGHTPVHVYRLRSQLADRYEVVIFVSRAGEILKVELPDGITLLHEKLGN